VIKKVIITVVSLALVALLGIKGKGLLEKRKGEIATEATPEKPQMRVSVVKAGEGDIVETRTFLATLQSDKSVKISTKIAGYIEKLYVDEGDSVKQGELLAKIDEEDINSNIEVLKTTLNQQYNDLALAKQIYERNQKLYDIGGLPREQLDTSRVIMQGKESAIKGTKAKIAQLQHQKEYLQIKAPFDGIVDTILLYGGDLAVMGKPILIESSGVKKLVFSYNLDNTNIRRGQRAFYNGEGIGEITTIKTLAKGGLAQAEIVLQKPLPIPLGSSININILTKQTKGCIVPNSSLIHKKDGVYIMVYRDEKFTPLKVQTSLSNERETIIDICPTEPIAIGNEVELSRLGAYRDIKILSK
jgi:RND family efflux transporter MFP subunit